VRYAAAMSERLLAEGARGCHFYTLNGSRATREIYEHLGLAARAAGGSGQPAGNPAHLGELTGPALARPAPRGAGVRQQAGTGRPCGPAGSATRPPAGLRGCRGSAAPITAYGGSVPGKRYPVSRSVKPRLRYRRRAGLSVSCVDSSAVRSSRGWISGGHHGPADPAALVGGMDMNLGHLERVA